MEQAVSGVLRGPVIPARIWLARCAGLGHDGNMNRKLTVPILILTVGAAWLMNTLSVVPNLDWVWTLGLAVCGILSLTIGGITKATLVLGPLLLAASVLSILHQTGRLHENHSIPILVILLGGLLLMVQLTNLGAEKPKADS